MWVSASHNLSRFHRQHVTISRRLRLTQLLIWLTPLFNRVPHVSRHIILQLIVPLRPTLCRLMFHCLRQVYILSIAPTAQGFQQRTCVPARSVGCGLYNLKQSLVFKLNKPDDNHLPKWYENAESRFLSAGVSIEEDWFNLFRDALSDEKANAWGSFHYTRCCFGLSNSPQSMQHLTGWLTSDLDNVEGYVDDFLVFSATPEEHESHLRLLIPKVSWCWSKNQSRKDRLRLLRS